MRHSRARVIAIIFGALVLVAAVAVSAVGGPSLKKLIKREVAKQLANKTGPQGPQGPSGPQGLRGSDAGSALLGGSNSTISGATNVNILAPMGESPPVMGGGIGARDMVAPNANLVARDLWVRIAQSPGAGNSWEFWLNSGVNNQKLTCPISSTGFTCNSGAQKITVPAGGQVYFAAVPTGGTPSSTNVDFGWRLVSP